MDTKEAIAAAKGYVQTVYADEQVMNVGLEEIEHLPDDKKWTITLGFSRPWSTPKTRAQEVLENIGALAPVQRSYKVITMTDDGVVLSMKDRTPMKDARRPE